jgi:hypothetical protein
MKPFYICDLRFAIGLPAAEIREAAMTAVNSVSFIKHPLVLKRLRCSAA